MNRLSRTERAQIIRALVEGNSLRSTTRITGRSINTVTKLLVELGKTNVTHRRAQRIQTIAEAQPIEMFAKAAEETADYDDSN